MNWFKFLRMMLLAVFLVGSGYMCHHFHGVLSNYMILEMYKTDFIKYAIVESWMMAWELVFMFVAYKFLKEMDE
jgi:hypothetical protein